MSPTERLVAIADALDEAALPFLVMGGHAVRYYGLERQTVDFDFHLSLTASGDLIARLRRTAMFGAAMLREEPGWRGPDFRRFQIGLLPSGREEWLEFWFRNHLLPAFDELYARRESGWVLRRYLNFLSLADLIHSKETEREDDWQDVHYLEEFYDERNLRQAQDDPAKARTMSQLRSRRGFETAMRHKLLEDSINVDAALRAASNPVTAAWLLPCASQQARVAIAGLLDVPVFEALSKCARGSGRHLALVEAVRIRYRRAAMAADAADKARFTAGSQER